MKHNAETGSAGRGADPTRRRARSIVGAIAAFLMGISFVGFGFLMCALPPQTTELLSREYCLAGTSPFTEDELVAAAVETRNYTVWGHDLDSLYTTIAGINRSAAEREGALPPGAPDLPEGDASTESLSAIFAQASEAYVLTPDALSHLDDVYKVVESAYLALTVTFIIAVAAVAFLVRTGARRTLASALIGGGAGVIALFALLGAWVAIDFNGFFSVFHSLFFAEGTWTFSIDSLLICMYPTGFWVGMGAVWLCATAASCLLAIAAGIIIKRSAARRPKTKPQEKEMAV